MSTGFFGDIQKIKYEGPDSTNPLAFRYYQPDEIVLGKRMEDHLRFAVAYWHTFTWPGGDPFGGQTFLRPWFEDTMQAAKLKADVAFEFFSLLGAPYYCFHDADVRPEGKNFAENTRNLNEIVDYFAEKQADRHQAALGHGESVLQPPLHVGCGHQSGSRCLRLLGRDRKDLPRRDAAARRRELRAVGRPRRL
jgi:xylose isomerase